MQLIASGTNDTSDPTDLWRSMFLVFTLEHLHPASRDRQRNDLTNSSKTNIIILGCDYIIAAQYPSSSLRPSFHILRQASSRTALFRLHEIVDSHVSRVLCQSVFYIIRHANEMAA
jgi:hypothetical protein